MYSLTRQTFEPCSPLRVANSGCKPLDILVRSRCSLRRSWLRRGLGRRHTEGRFRSRGRILNVLVAIPSTKVRGEATGHRPYYKQLQITRGNNIHLCLCSPVAPDRSFPRIFRPENDPPRWRRAVTKARMVGNCVACAPEFA